MKDTVDVVIIGSGPAGSVAAKTCAQQGMQTLLLEKEKLPRHKVCTGLLVSNLGRAIIAREFGPIPEIAMTEPPHIKGYEWHTEELGDQTQEKFSPGVTWFNTWRKELDYWMAQKAKEAGVKILEDALVTDVKEGGDGVVVKYKKGGEEEQKVARYVIGADGGTSVTRRSLFPSLKIPSVVIYSECYPGALNLNKEYFHIFGSSPFAVSNDWFDLIHKKDCFIISTNNRIRNNKETIQLAKQILSQKWGFNLESMPLWTAGHVVTPLREYLYSGEFIPAKKNILLVGDAGGLVTPSERGSGEGINTSLKSGLMAAHAIIKSAKTSKEVAPIYLSGVEQVLKVLKTLAANSPYYQTKGWKEREKLLDELI